MIEVNLSYTLKSAISQSVTTQITLPSEPEPEPPLTFPLRFNFGPADMPAVEGWRSLKFGQFEGNEYLQVLGEGVEGLPGFGHSAGFQEGVLFDNGYQPQNRYGWRRNPDYGTYVIFVLENLDTSKQYDIQVVALPPPGFNPDNWVDVNVAVYGSDDGFSNDFYEYKIVNPGGPVDEAPVSFPNVPPSPTGKIYIYINRLYDGTDLAYTINSLTISEAQ